VGATIQGTFAEERERLRPLLDELAAFASERDGERMVDAVAGLDAKLREMRFHAVVVGEFKRGKTTFVNALLGAPVLPTAVIPLTSIVTAVTWGPEPSAEVRFSDGRVRTVSPEELPGYITERENPGNRLRVERAVLSFPAEDLRDGVFLVDTPGVGSVYRHNTDAARRFVPEADVAIFLTSVDPPISESELAFLREVREHAGRVFFVLNKIDYLAEVDLAEAIAFTEGVLAEALERPVHVYPISARLALQAKVNGDAAAIAASGFEAFERDLRAFLLREKGATILRSVARRALALCADERNAIDVEERALALSAAERAEARRRMEEVFERVRLARGDLRPLLEAETRRLAAELEEELERLRRRTEDRLRAEVRRELEQHSGRPSRDALRDLTEQVLREEIDRWRLAQERALADRFRATTARFVERTEALVAETTALVGGILGIDLAAPPMDVSLTGDSRFSYSFFEIPTIIDSILPDVRRFLPTATARRMLLRDMEEHIREAVDKHCGRLRYDLTQRLERSRLELERALDGRLRDAVEALRRGLERAEREGAGDQGPAADPGLRAARERLDELARRLAELAGEAA
jgi:hypothetical protein